MASAWVKVSISLGGDWRLPSDAQGMLFRFRTDDDIETIVEGRLKTVGDKDITPGNVYEGGLFVEGDRAESLLEPGKQFVVWYVNDVGWGEVLQRVGGRTPYNKALQPTAFGGGGAPIPLNRPDDEVSRGWHSMLRRDLAPSGELGALLRCLDGHTSTCSYDLRYEYWDKPKKWAIAIAESAGGGGIEISYCPHCGTKLMTDD